MSNTSSASNSQDSPKKSGDGAGKGRLKPMEVLRQGRDEFTELTGMTPESVSSFERTEGGWQLQIEVLELARVPDTMSLLASYEVELTSEGELAGYRRVRRYERGRADAHRPGGQH